MSRKSGKGHAISAPRRLNAYHGRCSRLGHHDADAVSGMRHHLHQIQGGPWRRHHCAPNIHNMQLSERCPSNLFFISSYNSVVEALVSGAKLGNSGNCSGLGRLWNPWRSRILGKPYGRQESGSCSSAADRASADERATPVLRTRPLSHIYNLACYSVPWMRSISETTI